jgi:hypothetical protein
MHRSGTSLATRIVNLLGVDLGPEDHLLRPTPDNPKGFWEHRRIVKLNDEVLERLGGSFARPPAFWPGWETAPQLEHLRNRAQGIIQEEFAGKASWGWKDPRTCLTLPFWQRLLPPMRYVICLRNPLDVMRSMWHRDGLTAERGIYLWVTYTRLALQHTRGQPRILVAYERLVDDWRGELRRLARFLGTVEQAEREDLRATVRDFVDPSLRHHRTPRPAAPENGGSEVSIRARERVHAVYAALEREPLPAEVEDVDRLFQPVMDVVVPEIERQEQEEYRRWREQIQQVIDDISRVIPAGEAFLLADEGEWDTSEFVAGRRRIPFPERDGQPWDPPPDDETALRELERMRQAGAAFFVLGSPAFWWRDHYVELHGHLRSAFRCALENERLMIFDLRT